MSAKLHDAYDAVRTMMLAFACAATCQSMIRRMEDSESPSWQAAFALMFLIGVVGQLVYFPTGLWQVFRYCRRYGELPL